MVVLQRIRQDIKAIYPAIVIIIAYIVLTQFLFGKICPFAILWHLPCPGCGLTRAAFYTFCGKFVAAFHMNAAIFLWIPYLMYLCFWRYVAGKKPPAATGLVIIIGLATIACYVYRLIAGIPAGVVI